MLDEFVGLCDVGERDALGDFEAGPTIVERGVEVAGGSGLCFGREVVAAKKEQAIVFEDELPEGDFGGGVVGCVGGDGGVGLEQLGVGIDVCGEGDFDDVVDAVGSDGFYARDEIFVGDEYGVCSGGARSGLVVGESYGADDEGPGKVGELRGADADSACCSLNENGASCNRSGDVYGAVRGDAGNAEACALLHRDGVGKRRYFFNGDDGEFGGGAEGAVGLRSEAPDAAAEPFGRDTGADLVDVTGSVAVRNDARVGHADGEGVLAFFDVAGINAGESDADAELAGARFGVGHFSDGEDFAGGTLLFVPCGFHADDLTPVRLRPG